MTRVEIIKQLEKTLESIDVLMGSIDSDSDESKKLDAQRKEISDRMDILIKQVFVENTQVYGDLTAKISQINSELQNSINETENAYKTINTLTQLMTAIDEIIKIGAKIAA